MSAVRPDYSEVQRRYARPSVDSLCTQYPPEPFMHKHIHIGLGAKVDTTPHCVLVSFVV